MKRLDIPLAARFGALVVVGETVVHYGVDGGAKRALLLRCDCGASVARRASTLLAKQRAGRHQSCRECFERAQRGHGREREAICAALTEHGTLTSHGVARAAGLPIGRAQHLLREMSRRGTLEFICGLWKLAEPPPSPRSHLRVVHSSDWRLELGRGDRREDCRRYLACLDAWTSGRQAQCPSACGGYEYAEIHAHGAPRSSPIAEAQTWRG